jgi:hypothetical protein
LAQSRKDSISFASKVHHRWAEIEFILTTRFRYATPDQKIMACSFWLHVFIAVAAPLCLIALLQFKAFCDNWRI